MYLLRLDDASEYMNEKNWRRMEALLDRYSIKPIVGVIPDNRDDSLKAFGEVPGFWEKVKGWKDKGWTIALHGYSHIYETNEGGINPVHQHSEFAGHPLDIQKQKIRNGNEILLKHGIKAELFYAPSHTFDWNTVRALKEETEIRIISDTVANDVYYENDFYFIPQQSGVVRKLPFKTVTFCYHPNTIKDSDFEILEDFLAEHNDEFGMFHHGLLKKRKKSFYDRFINRLYFIRR